MAKFPLSCHDDIHILYNVEAIKREYLGDKEKYLTITYYLVEGQLLLTPFLRWTPFLQPKLYFLVSPYDV